MFLALDEIVTTFGEMILGAALGVGGFVGSTRAKFFNVTRAIDKLEKKLDDRFDKLDTKLSEHAIALAKLPCKEKCDGEA
jgi:hypothetical protein